MARRGRHGKVPIDQLDVLAGGQAELAGNQRERALALGLSIQTADERRCELALVCPGETRAETLKLELENLVAAVTRDLPSHIADLKNSTDQYRQLLEELLAALSTSHYETSDSIIWLRLNWAGKGLPAWAESRFENEAAERADWLAAARAADEANHRGLLQGLLKYVAAQNPPHFPEAAHEAETLRPESRLSWIAEILPFLGHSDWNLKSAYDWNSTENQPFTQRTLDEVVNPAFGPATNSKGYPVTHYVGAAGVGEDAARLKSGDPRAGMFGYGRQTRQQDLARGGANTIAVLGVQGQCGPWAQGGKATVRALTQQPYINGPDGFGSGQAEGMVVGMADGSVRFLSKDIDPHVMEQLVSVAEGSHVDMSTIDPQPPAAAEPVGPLVIAKPAELAKPQAAAAVAKPPVESPVDRKLRVMLSEPVQKISLSNMPLEDAVNVAASIAAINVSFDPDAMEELGVSLRDPVTIEAADATVDSLLKQIAATRNMTVLLDQRAGARYQPARISPRAAIDSLHCIRFDARRCPSGGRTGESYSALRCAGILAGRRRKRHDRRLLAGRVADHAKRRSPLSDHRVLRKTPHRPRPADEKPSRRQETQPGYARLRREAILGHVTSINTGTATPLSEILERFKQPAGTEILIDRPALAMIGVSENVMTKLRSENLPQGIVLKQLLEPLGLGWRALDSGALQVTMKSTALPRDRGNSSSTGWANN